jgi:hypothetical protein
MLGWLKWDGDDKILTRTQDQLVRYLHVAPLNEECEVDGQELVVRILAAGFTNDQDLIAVTVVEATTV